MSGSLNALGAVHLVLRLSMMRWWLALNSYPQAYPQVDVDKATHRFQSLTRSMSIWLYLKDIYILIKDKEKKKKENNLNTYKSVIVLSILILTTMPVNAAKAVEQSDLLKLYAHSRIINYEQFKCFDALITKESNWRVDARNGSHYGLGQMRNAKYRKLDGFTQVDWSIRYITKRYGSMCNAWRFFKDKGYH
jgi:hypothetical protein